MQKCGGQILFTSKSVSKTWRFKTPAKMCCTFLGKSAGEAGRVFSALRCTAHHICYSKVLNTRPVANKRPGW